MLMCEFVYIHVCIFPCLNTERVWKWFLNTLSTERTALLKKHSILVLGPGKNKVTLEHYIVPEIKNMLKE